MCSLHKISEVIISCEILKVRDINKALIMSDHRPISEDIMAEMQRFSGFIQSTLPEVQAP